ncbi:hypothetical protein [Massilia phyllosphaerae]|uniref:hypothetical protein n=1 Tax=Massilia phyllosphaerae TaxID=3106034 RepID=UPI002B1CC4F5|nr:hypothetical protein [Massilia sp. SGZ-792]
MKDFFYWVTVESQALKAQRQPQVVVVEKLMKVNSTHFHGSLLCPPEKKFFQFVTFHRSVAHSRQCPKMGQLFYKKLKKSAVLRLISMKKTRDISHMRW